MSHWQSGTMDSDGNSQVSPSKKWLALAELTCNWQLKRGNSCKFHGARGTLRVGADNGFAIFKLIPINLFASQ